MAPDFYAALRHFKRTEFEYPYEMDEGLLRKLDIARSLAGIPFVINDDYRTPADNERVGGSKNSAHLRGLAVDIACPDSHTRHLMYDGLRTAGFRRIGIGSNYIHADIDDSLPQEVTWLYK